MRDLWVVVVVVVLDEGFLLRNVRWSRRLPWPRGVLEKDMYEISHTEVVKSILIAEISSRRTRGCRVQ